jgi:hypothetical protein
MGDRKILLTVAMFLAGVGVAGQASAKIYVDNGWLADGDVKHDILATYSNNCAFDNLVFGTNDGLVQVG